MEYPLCAVKEWEHLTLDQQLSWYLKPPQTLNLMCNLDRNWNMVNQLDLQEKIQIRQIINVANFWGGDTCIFVFLGYLNMRALSKSSSETQTLKISIYPKNMILREIFCLTIVFFYQITVCIMKYGVIWKSCQYLYGLVIIKLFLWRAVLIMWTTHISKWLSALQRKKLIK